MNKHYSIMKDMKEILETVSSVGEVTIGKHVPLDQEDSWASVYILPGADTFVPRVIGTGVSSYDNTFFIRCIVNDNCSDDDLTWTNTRDDIIQAVLKDSGIWTTSIDRDITSIVYDDFNSFPLMTMELLFMFTLREECT